MINLNSSERLLMDYLERARALADAAVKIRQTTEQETIRLREETQNLRRQLDSAERRANEARLPLVEAIFDYDGARRYVRLLGMVKSGTLQCYDIGAGHVKNYLLGRIQNLQIVEAGYAEAAYKATLPQSFIGQTVTGRFSSQPNLQDTPRSPRTIRGTW